MYEIDPVWRELRDSRVVLSHGDVCKVTGLRKSDVQLRKEHGVWPESLRDSTYGVYAFEVAEWCAAMLGVGFGVERARTRLPNFLKECSGTVSAVKAAAVMGVSTREVRRMCQEGRLVAFGGARGYPWRIPVEEIEKLRKGLV